MIWTIEGLKALARQANAVGDWRALQEIIEELDDIWTDDAAAQTFYTELEQTAEHED